MFHLTRADDRQTNATNPHSQSHSHSHIICSKPNERNAQRNTRHVQRVQQTHTHTQQSLRVNVHLCWYYNVSLTAAHFGMQPGGMSIIKSSELPTTDTLLPEMLSVYVSVFFLCMLSIEADNISWMRTRALIVARRYPRRVAISACDGRNKHVVCVICLVSDRVNEWVCTYEYDDMLAGDADNAS